MNRSIFNILKKNQHTLFSQLRQNKSVHFDMWNNLKDNHVHIEFFDNNAFAGMINYKVAVGQVSLLYLEKKYQNKGIGKEILLQTMTHMKEYKTPYIWTLCNNKNHFFWSNVFQKKFVWCENEMLHPSVHGSGFKMKM